jgi:hypothetical protein
MPEDRKRKPAAQVFRTSAEAEAADREMYRQMTPQERLDLALELYHRHYGDRIGRLARVYKVIERERR